MILVLSIALLLSILVGCAKNQPPPGLNELQVKGWETFENKWCYSCHVIKDKGGKIGPELTYLARKRDKEWLKKYLQDPKNIFPNAKMEKVRMFDGELNALVEYLMTLK